MTRRNVLFAFICLLVIGLVTACDDELKTGDQIYQDLEMQLPQTSFRYLGPVGHNQAGQETAWAFQMLEDPKLTFEVHSRAGYQELFGRTVISYDTTFHHQLLSYYYQAAPDIHPVITSSPPPNPTNEVGKLHFSYRSMAEYEEKMAVLKAFLADLDRAQPDLQYDLMTIYDTLDQGVYYGPCVGFALLQEGSAADQIAALEGSTTERFTSFAIQHAFWPDDYRPEEVLAWVAQREEGQFTLLDQDGQSYRWPDLLLESQHSGGTLTLESFFLILERMGTIPYQGNKDHFSFQGLDGHTYTFSNRFYLPKEDPSPEYPVESYYLKDGTRVTGVNDPIAYPRLQAWTGWSLAYGWEEAHAEEELS